MKHNIPLFTLLVLTLMTVSIPSFAGTTYSISSNKNWSAVLPSTCANCTISISSGVTLTVDQSSTCQNCTITGGTIVLNNQTLNIQYTGSLTTTYFNSTNLIANGNNAQLIVNAPLSLSNSTFTFNNNSYFNTSYEVDLSSSKVYLYDNATMMSTGSSSTPINLLGSSEIVIGNGSQTSTAAFTVSGPTLNLVGQNASVSVANSNNSYNNWANFSYSPSPAANANANKSYSTQNNNMNCGGSYPHSCGNPSVYGPVSLNSAGVVRGGTLPVVLVGFTAVSNDKNITLDWNTQIEANSSRFDIERSADGTSWTTIGSVMAKGNSSLPVSYSFTDQNPLSGVGYYHLRMVDLDNSYVYSEVKVVRTSMVSAVSFFPNPAREYVNVSLGSAASVQTTVRLSSISGQVLQEKRAESGNGAVVTFAVGNYAPGLYILSVIGTDGKQESRQLVIARS
ncbi:MAG: T9SS type A sorting domain-containing protein [Bacteroidetes bacterium]|nr:T9SS type A sorting domain-containing protein [Bacteroidota bacterium]